MSVERDTLRKLSTRLLPFLILLFMVAWIDRTNVGFAKETLERDLGMSSFAYFAGGGAFFIVYALLEVPSNLILARVGARKWFSRILISWGIATVATSLVTTDWAFYLMRAAVGACEAGLFPGVIFYLTRWMPQRHRAKVFGTFILANPLSFIIGNPLLGLLGEFDGAAGLSAWQWIFIVTGIPPIVLGIITYFVLPDGPDSARWLSSEQRDWIRTELAKDDAEAPGAHTSVGAALRSAKVWYLGFAYMMIVIGMYGMAFWLPTVVGDFNVSSTLVGLLTTIPYLAGAAALIWVPRHADRTGDQHWHCAVPLLTAAAALVGAVYFQSPILMLACMAVAAAGLLGACPSFWSISASLFTGTTAAASLALINSISALGGWIGPSAIGAVVDATDTPITGMWIIIAAATIGAAAILSTKRFAGAAASPRTPEMPSLQ